MNDGGQQWAQEGSLFGMLLDLTGSEVKGPGQRHGHAHPAGGWGGQEVGGQHPGRLGGRVPCPEEGRGAVLLDVLSRRSLSPSWRKLGGRWAWRKPSPRNGWSHQAEQKEDGGQRLWAEPCWSGRSQGCPAPPRPARHNRQHLRSESTRKRTSTSVASPNWFRVTRTTVMLCFVLKENKTPLASAERRFL